ncbi:hypothetical protein MRB53_019218 [Persea americana]|uniref:Uncharacterized protein n=1 Tax=Persea americana TaxID=3435 RepID=A0ACC2KYE3_PERAE|nr:hypothetical protein MRB53_019218 [Persea americana]
MIRTPFPFHGARSNKCVEREAIGPTSIDLTEAPEEEVEEAEEGNDACEETSGGGAAWPTEVLDGGRHHDDRSRPARWVHDVSDQAGRSSPSYAKQTQE